MAFSRDAAQFCGDHGGQQRLANHLALCVEALGGRPGVHSARYAGEPSNPARNIEKLLHELEGVPAGKRTARFRCVVSYIENGALTQFEGICEGHINFAPVEGGGFGYDPVFVADGYGCTLAELTMEEKNKISHRGRAMDLLKCHLSQNQGL